MWAMTVVVMDPALEHGGALRGVVVGDAVGPLAKCRLNEALGLAVGLWPVGFGEAVLERQIAASAGKALRAKCRAVVGKDALGTHAQGAEVAHGVLKELD